jgi:colanic acid biosynthesis protein WcaH
MATFIPADQYEFIKRAMPIPCVDLLVVNDGGQILLTRRANDPARGCWWLPGGRVAFGETREQAARRKLREECGLESISTRELRTFDLLLGEGQSLSHGISTVFLVAVHGQPAVVLDNQSSAAWWRTRAEWLAAEELHPFVRNCLAVQF